MGTAHRCPRRRAGEQAQPRRRLPPRTRGPCTEPMSDSAPRSPHIEGRREALVDGGDVKPLEVVVEVQLPVGGDVVGLAVRKAAWAPSPRAAGRRTRAERAPAKCQRAGLAPGQQSAAGPSAEAPPEADHLVESGSPSHPQILVRPRAVTQGESPAVVHVQRRRLAGPASVSTSMPR